MADTAFIPDDGVQAICGVLSTSGSWWNGKVLRLFTNNITPSKSSVIGDFTEASWAGYSAHTITTGGFSTVVVSAHVASSAYSNVSFTRSTTGTAANNYGWYITDAGGSPTKVYAAARFAGAPLTVTNSGDFIQLTGQAATVQSVN